MGEDIAKYILKKKLSILQSKEGRGTELISLYIPPERNIFEVTKYLRKEYDQSSNIKDKNTRKNVHAALESLLQHLKLYKKPPPNGLVLFCGAIPRDNIRGTEKIELYALEPPEKIPFFLYRCDQRFYLEPLTKMLKEKHTYGLISMDRGGASIGILRGSRYEIIQRLKSLVPPKHSAGGQSQRRFERLREVSVNEYYKKLGERVNKVFLKIENLQGIIVGGPGDAKEEFVQGDYLHYTLKQKVIALVNTSYTGESGIRELVLKSGDLIKDTALYRERRLVQEVMVRLAKDPELVVYGREDVEKALIRGAIEKIIVLDNLNIQVVNIACLNCGNEIKYYLEDSNATNIQDKLSTMKCERCGGSTFTVKESKDFIEHLIKLAKQYGTHIEIISSGTEWADQIRALGGIVGLLRFKV